MILIIVMSKKGPLFFGTTYLVAWKIWVRDLKPAASMQHPCKEGIAVGVSASGVAYRLLAARMCCFCGALCGCFCKFGVLLVGVLMIRRIL